MTSVRAAGCCCGSSGTVGIFCPNDTAFKSVAAFPAYAGYSIEGIFKNIYDDKNKGSVVRIDSEATLMNCNVAFFGVLTPTNVPSTSPAVKGIFSPEVVAGSIQSNAGVTGYASQWWTSATLSEALSKFVAKGGRLVMIGEGFGTSSSPSISVSAVSHANAVLNKSNNNNQSSIAVNFSIGSTCNLCFGECFCTTSCAKFTAVKSVVPDTPFSFYQNNGIYNSSGCYLSFFAPGSTIEGTPLVGAIPVGQANSCGNPFLGSLTPAAYTQLSGGYQIVVSDINCFLPTPFTAVLPFNQQSPNDGGCADGLAIPSNMNSACNPEGLFTGVPYFNLNLPFLWTLNEKCPTC